MMDQFQVLDRPTLGTQLRKDILDGDDPPRLRIGPPGRKLGLDLRQGHLR